MAKAPKEEEIGATGEEVVPEARIEPAALGTESSLMAAIERQNRQIEDLGRMTSGLAELVANVQAQSHRDAAFLSAVDGVRTASAAVTAAAATTAALPPGVPGPIIDATGRELTAKDPCGGGGPCECNSPGCCCFDIVMTGMRALAMQPLELEDSDANPWADLEVQVFAYLAGGIGAVIPSLFSTIPLGKLIQHPGAWVTVERKIGNICLPKGKSKLIEVFVDAIESDKGLLERLTGGRDEEGSAKGSMMLDCCCSTEPKLTFDVQFTSGGQGGGAIEVAFAARRSC